MNDQTTTFRMGIYGAVINIAGIVLSGPLGLILIALLHPTPAWQTPQLWAASYHPIKTLPFFCGFLLLGGYVMMIAAAHRMTEAREKVYTSVALLFTAAFATLIFFNYITQTTFLPALARHYRPEYDGVISALAFDNPLSLCWAIEMWGYALLGVATMFTARIFTRSRTERITAGLMITNGVMSLLGAFYTAFDLGWVMTPAGFINYNIWNALVVMLSVFFLLSLRKRMTENRVSGLQTGRPTRLETGSY